MGLSRKHRTSTQNFWKQDREYKLEEGLRVQSQNSSVWDSNMKSHQGFEGKNRTYGQSSRPGSWPWLVKLKTKLESSSWESGQRGLLESWQNMGAGESLGGDTIVSYDVKDA